MGENVFLSMLQKAGIQIDPLGTFQDRFLRLKSLMENDAPQVIIANQCALVALAAAKEGNEHCKGTLREVFKVLEAQKTCQAVETRTDAPPLAGRNEPCPCGSGKKYKKCCLGKSND